MRPLWRRGVSAMAHGWMFAASGLVVLMFLVALANDYEVKVNFNTFGEGPWEIPLMLLFFAAFIVWYLTEKVYRL